MSSDPKLLVFLEVLRTRFEGPNRRMVYVLFKRIGQFHPCPPNAEYRIITAIIINWRIIQGSSAAGYNQIAMDTMGNILCSALGK